ncbi:hypothetical protein K435DRAFT_797680 [Dendrothele bispora CBS 962.96]|uniref:Uncharacterized protein n=1 Tax=Dendrothele bispora (strain CBS 962.96) TaxID=1314807 RepID=A0A4S8M2T1_DENBC|nr:hypothetical protein K435DRAFT_797680 [Dendrothele bispora CBS 962.96]
MEQQNMTAEEQKRRKENGLYSVIFRRRLQTPSGFWQERYPKSFFSATPDERRLHFEQTWSQGGFSFLINNYFDFGTSDEANAEVYVFWRQKVHARAEILAPKVAPHPLGAERPSLEQTYYEVYNQPNVTLTDLSKYPIEEITPKGVKTGDGVQYWVQYHGNYHAYRCQRERWTVAEAEVGRGSNLLFD